MGHGETHIMRLYNRSVLLWGRQRLYDGEDRTCAVWDKKVAGIRMDVRHVGCFTSCGVT